MHVRRDRYIGVAPLPGGLANACVVTADRGASRSRTRCWSTRCRCRLRVARRFGRARRVSRPQCLGPLAVEPRLRRARSAARGRRRRLHRSDDRRRAAVRAARRRAGRARSAHALEHGGADAHLRLAPGAPREFARKWRFNRALRSLVGSPLAVRAAALGARWAPGCYHVDPLRRRSAPRLMLPRCACCFSCSCRCCSKRGARRAQRAGAARRRRDRAARRRLRGDAVAYPLAFLLPIGEAWLRGIAASRRRGRRRVVFVAGQGAQILGDRHARSALDLPRAGAAVVSSARRRGPYRSSAIRTTSAWPVSWSGSR